MQEIDRIAQVKYGIPSIVLMENAGRRVAEEVLKRYPEGRGAIFCGRGNNGGDGFVCARHLENAGIKTGIFLIGKLRDIKKEGPFININILKKMRVKIFEILKEVDIENARKAFRYDFIVDAIFGTGFSGEPADTSRSAIRFMNKSGKPIFSIDVPSGINATTGQMAGSSVIADTTITFGLAKSGLLSKKASSSVGRLVIGDIGLPKEILK